MLRTRKQKCTAIDPETVVLGGDQCEHPNSDTRSTETHAPPHDRLLVGFQMFPNDRAAAIKITQELAPLWTRRGLWGIE
ncbi:hypothetical protein AAFF_G00039370 [Aldrovandia affinis]|uniref:Uncharacterized protein n=1 Tax=Aldrovandia affinis TaxID=143900 RepID=A0AAD7S553_9TELE|nr:hypothetical protein AAFF_G00039370 [Aldrovandia affinis]